ncbi:MAG: ribosome recycling factor [Candidatus Omnitrophica bacterium]|nr:ribosome recycling factor [Candidatus Omnitrophota bacterium]MDD5573730.1 ribosome recycling factor [Candidatus Omnitrophota bacterium]
MNTREIIKDVESKMKKALEAARRNFSEIRTGRASPHLVEGLHVDYYGTPTVLKSLASITVPDARLIIIQPWDASVIPEIEKAISKSNLGINPFNDGKIVRLQIPQLTQERREELKKVVKTMAEEGRISLRTIRRDANDAVKKLETDKVIPEDERFRSQEEIQKITDKSIAELESVLKDKEKELMEV